MSCPEASSCSSSWWANHHRSRGFVVVAAEESLVASESFSVTGCMVAHRALRGAAHRRVRLLVVTSGGSSWSLHENSRRLTKGYRRTLEASKSRSSSRLLVRMPHIVESKETVRCRVGRRTADSLVVALSSCSSSRLVARKAASGLGVGILIGNRGKGSLDVESEVRPVGSRFAWCLVRRPPRRGDQRRSG